MNKPTFPEAMEAVLRAMTKHPSRSLSPAGIISTNKPTFRAAIEAVFRFAAVAVPFAAFSWLFLLLLLEPWERMVLLVAELAVTAILVLARLVRSSSHRLDVKAREMRPTRNSLRIHPYRLQNRNAFEIKYVGNEAALDLEVWQLYKNTMGREVKKQVEEFYPENDDLLLWTSFRTQSLEENQVIRFRVVDKRGTQNGKIINQCSFTGAKTGTRQSLQRKFRLAC